MMDHPNEQSKRENKDEPSKADDEQRSYYYDDATNYETYRNDEDDEEESLPSDNRRDQLQDVRSCLNAS
jgi:hypothetical protein